MHRLISSYHPNRWISDNQGGQLDIIYDSNKPELNRLKNISHDGQAIEDDKIYRVGTTAFVAIGGDGYTIFTEGKTVDNSSTMADILYQEFKQAKNSHHPNLEDRLM